MEQTDTLFKPDARQLAPLVIVATVLDNRVVLSNRPAARLPNVSLDLHLVRVRLENTLKNTLRRLCSSLKNCADVLPDVSGPELSFYYFGQHDPRGWNPFYGFLYEAEPGKRYIFFLYREKEVLRSIGDVGEYSLLVRSGAHPRYISPAPYNELGPPYDDAILGRAVADILLTKGEGADPAAFAYGLDDRSSMYFANRWGSRAYTVQLLRKLLLEPEPVRQTVCYELVKWFSGQEDCLSHIADDPGEPIETRTRAREQQAKVAMRRRDLLEKLRSDTLDLNIEFPDSRKRILDELRSLLLSPDDAVRKAACTAIRRHYPEDTKECGQ